MEAHKDISEMSFEEFFSEPVVRAERKDSAKAVPPKEPPISAESMDVRQGFAGAGPKVNYTAGRFQLYIPRYAGLDTDRFDAAIDCSRGVIPMGQLEAARQKGGRTTRPSTLDLTSVGVSPLEPFKLTIDGEVVFVNKSCQLMFFNNIGMPMGRPGGDTYAVHLPTIPLKLIKAQVIDETVKHGLVITHLDVSVAGGVWPDDPAPVEQSPIIEESAVEVPVVEPKPVKAKKSPGRRPRAKGSMTLSVGTKDAEVIYGGETLPLYPSEVVAHPTVEGCELSECTVSMRSETGDMVIGPLVAAPSVRFNARAVFGPVSVVLEKNEKVLAECKLFLIPGFKCSYGGNGDIVDDPVVEYSFAGISGTRNIYDEDAYGPFDHNGITFYIRWALPAVMYDIGDGPVRFASTEINISDLQADRMRVIVKGAKKKALYFGGERGKKTDLAPGWSEDYYDVDLEPIREEVYSHPDVTYCFYLTVNSFPNRRFISISNPRRVTAGFEGSCVVADVTESALECVCRLHKLENIHEDFPLAVGENRVPVDDDVIEAEVLEMDGPKVRLSMPVSVRYLPFLHKDGMGDLWLYVSKSKRIPLPTGLIVDGSPVNDAIRAWHGRIVRMNPEMKAVTLSMMLKAFSDYGE